ncbi:hypothetical protein KZ779_00135 [Escherichia coli]|nr:hypothetical protein [Escherichia coli]
MLPHLKARVEFFTPLFLTSDFLSVFMGSYRTECASFFQKTAKLRWLVQVQSMSFPGVTGMAGADFADTKDVKKPTGEAGFFYCYATKLMTLTRKELSITDAKK